MLVLSRNRLTRVPLLASRSLYSFYFEELSLPQCRAESGRVRIRSLSSATSSSVGWCRKQALPFSLRREDHRESRKTFPPSCELLVPWEPLNQC